MLRDVIDRGTGSPRARRWALRVPAAGRRAPPTTSRTPGSWASRSSVVAGVWVGFDQPATIGDEAYGARVALPIWADFMRRAARACAPEEFEPPAGPARRSSCAAITFLRPVDGCPTYIEYFKDGDDVPDRAVPDPPRAASRSAPGGPSTGCSDGIGRQARAHLQESEEDRA